MTVARRERLLGLLDPGSCDPVALLRRVCELCIFECSVSGASMSIGGSGTDGNQALVHATNARSVLLEDLQRTVGEGPGHAARDTRGPVLVPDLSINLARWPGYTPGAQAAGAAAVFSFPLQVGAVSLGLLDLHRTSAGSLGRDQLGDVLLLAEIATHAALDDLGSVAAMDMARLSDIHAVVHQATGIVSVQLTVSMREALVRIRAHAYANQLPLNEVARQIVDKRLRLTRGQ
ncbi:ANTAR domain-containing protein [Amycolatopsis marina]|uniref:ANTAR domain-containing protein n=1 Tax=Amycolatopsis marina TaxID=490629 RepID=A0A1I0VJ22_9PSEU|nr:ANTAR domain-containing protein [Amycolatopsis marina]SFA76037.1 ANTAR domain-containing protein [Amycolatopsis marina]